VLLAPKDAAASLPPEVRTTQNLGVLRTALECYRRDCERYPTTGEGLFALVHPLRVQGWKGPYITMLKPDPWHNPYLYGCTNETVFLSSAGPDGLPETEDDIAAPPPDMEYVLHPPKPVEVQRKGEDQFVEIILPPKEK
jgi:type II secretion system protein G